MTFDRRTYGRERRRRQLAAEKAARQSMGTRCAHRLGRHFCGARLDFVTDGSGGVRAVCRLCERRLAGICRDCPQRVAGAVGRTLRCAACKRLVVQASQRRSEKRHLAARRARAREYGREHREERAAYKRLWRAMRPAKKQLYETRHMANPKAAAKRRRYHRAYRAVHGDRRATAPRTCIDGCGTVVTGRAKRCDACRAQRKRDARALIAARLTGGKAA